MFVEKSWVLSVLVDVGMCLLNEREGVAVASAGHDDVALEGCSIAKNGCVLRCCKQIRSKTTESISRHERIVLICQFYGRHVHVCTTVPGIVHNFKKPSTPHARPVRVEHTCNILRWGDFAGLIKRLEPAVQTIIAMLSHAHRTFPLNLCHEIENVGG